jgi:uncharacterized damage-inducible protein DinB
MEGERHLRRLLAHDHWANLETLGAMQRNGEPPGRAVQIFAHVVAAEHLWLGRLKGEPQRHLVWPEWSLAECAARAAELPQIWHNVLQVGERLADPVRYTNSKNEPWTNTPEDIVLHVVMHSAYHRGQIATAMRGAGQTPAYTDFVHCIRNGFVE